MNGGLFPSRGQFRLAFWRKNVGPFRFYTDRHVERCEHFPPHRLNVVFDDLEDAWVVACQHMAENPGKKFPIGILDQADNCVAVIEGDYHIMEKRHYPGVKRYYYTDPCPESTLVVVV